MKIDMNKIIVFIHVKKTGGISLQWVLAQQFGKKFFGGHIHGNLKKVAAKNPIEKTELLKVPMGSCICKHWTYDDFAPIHDRAKFITILRNPVDRIISHYNFYRQHHVSGCSFNEYIHDVKNINIYSKFLPQDTSLLDEIYSFDDLQYCLNRSRIVSKIIGSPFPHMNKTKDNHKVKQEDIEIFKKLNEQDLEFYKRIELDILQ